MPISAALTNPASVKDVCVSTDLDRAAWSEYVRTTADGGLYHRLEWDAALAIYRLHTLRLTATCEGRVVGVLPLVVQQSRLFGRRLASLPWFDSAGSLADSVEALEALLTAALSHAARCGATEIHLRQIQATPQWQSPRTDKVLMRLTLQPKSDDLWKELSAKVRNQVRKGEKSGLTYECGGPSLVHDFFGVYATNMRDLGSPSHSEGFFEAVVAAFGDDVQVHVVRLAAMVVGCGLTLANGRFLEIPWASSLREYNPLCVNHFLYWNILRQACERRYEFFHFGRSTAGSGTWHFKRQWGAVDVPLYWYSLASDGTPIAQESRPEESFALAQRAWRRLPLWLSRRLGPRIICNVC